MVKYPADGATLQGRLIYPKGPGPFPAVIVLDRGGASDAGRDAARRLAARGYLALAVDPLSRQGGTASFATQTQARAALERLDEQWVSRDLKAARRFLRSRPSALSGGITVVRLDESGLATSFGWE